MTENHIIHGDCFTELAKLADGSIDCVIIDPPYGILTGHKIETNIDIDAIHEEIFRVLKPGGFYAFFCQMPTLVDWCVSARQHFKLKDHICWAKRAVLSPYLELPRTHESFMIYYKPDDKTLKYHCTEGLYGDIKPPLYAMGLLEANSMRLYIKCLWDRIDGKVSHKSDSIMKNDKCHSRMIQGRRYENGKKLCKFTNLWSFLPQNKINNDPSCNQSEECNIKHPTVKPILFLERALQLLTKEGDTVLDCFSGSGTTAIAAWNINRNSICVELDEEYYDLSVKRFDNHTRQGKLF